MRILVAGIIGAGAIKPVVIVLAYLLAGGDPPMVFMLVVALLTWVGAGWLAASGDAPAMKVWLRGLTIWMGAWGILALLAISSRSAMVDQALLMTVGSVVLYGISLLISREWGREESKK